MPRLSAGQLGFALAFTAFGASCAMPLAGRISHRFGSRAGAARTARPVDAGPGPAVARARTCSTLCLALFVVRRERRAWRTSR